MISDLLSSAQPDAQSDRLLLLAAAVIGGIGLTWLLISQPWSSGAQELSAAQVEPVQLATQEPLQVEASQGRTELSTNLDNPLRMAQLAFEAGMLIEPEDYSAWALFAVVLENEPDNGLAHEGLVKIANSLLLRGQSAVEQGRFDDARETIGRILPVLPDHSGALALAGRIEASAPRPAPRIAVAA